MKSIVVYFSRTGQNYSGGTIVDLKQGNTAVAAGFIHDITGADLFEIKPDKTYPVDYYECTDIAKDELNANARPNLVNWPKMDMSQYDVIYVAYPIWWGTFPMAVFTFLEHYDWGGKIIMPLATHEGSNLGHSVADIKRICPGADVRGGLAVYGSGVKSAKPAIEKWIREQI